MKTTAKAIAAVVAGAGVGYLLSIVAVEIAFLSSRALSNLGQRFEPTLRFQIALVVFACTWSAWVGGAIAGSYLATRMSLPRKVCHAVLGTLLVVALCGTLPAVLGVILTLAD